MLAFFEYKCQVECGDFVEISDSSSKVKILAIKNISVSFQFLFRYINKIPSKRFSSAAHIFFSDKSGFFLLNYNSHKTPMAFQSWGTAQPVAQAELTGKANKQSGTSARNTLTVITVSISLSRASQTLLLSFARNSSRAGRSP